MHHYLRGWRFPITIPISVLICDIPQTTHIVYSTHMLTIRGNQFIDTYYRVRIYNMRCVILHHALCAIIMRERGVCVCVLVTPTRPAIQGTQKPPNQLEPPTRRGSHSIQRIKKTHK